MVDERALFSSTIHNQLSTIAEGWGPGQRPDLALEAFSRRIAAGLPVVINGDGSQRRDLTHVSDVARAVELALRWPGPGSVVLNVGTGRNHSVLDMAEAAAKNVAALHFSGLCLFV